MPPLTVDYAPPRPRWRIPLWLKLIPLAVLFLVLAYLPIGSTQIRIDAITGSGETRTIWPMGIVMPPVRDPSPLETRLKSMNLQPRRNWRTISTIEHSLFGHVSSRACSNAPPILQFRPAADGFARNATNEQIREFLRIMENGTEAEQMRAIEDAGEIAFR